MSDRALCVGQRPEGADTWDGRLSGCPHLWAYQVRGAERRFNPRTVLQKQGSDGSAAAGIVVILTDGSTHHFGLPQI